jgi:two-component system, response regulator YesN
MKRRNALLPFYLSYAVGLIVPVLMGMLFYARTTELAEQYTAAQIDTVVEEVGRGIESIYRDVQFVSSQLSLDVEVVRHASTTFAIRREAVAALLDVSVGSAAIATVSQNRFLDQFYLVLPANDTVIGNAGKFSLQTFARFELGVAEDDLEVFADSLSRESYTFRWNDAVGGTVGAPAGMNELLLLHTFRPVTQPLGLFLWVVNRQEIERAFARVDMDAGGLLILRDAQGTIIHTTYQEGPDFSVSRGADRLGLLREVAENRLGTVRTVRSPNGFVSIDAYLSPDNVRNRISYVQTTTLLIVVALVVVNTVLVLVFSARSSRPIRAMMRAVGAAGDSSAQAEITGLRYLQESVTDLVGKTRKLELETERQRPFINSLLMESLIAGIRMTDEELHNLLADGQIELGNFHCCFVVAVSPYAVRDASDFYNEFLVKNRVISQVLGECISGNLYYLLQGSDRVVYVHGSLETDKAVYYGRVSSQLRAAYRALVERIDVDLYVGIGAPVSKPSRIRTSYDQAMSALSRISADATDGFVEFQALMESSTSHYYPMDLEIRLLNAVRSGDAKAVEGVIRRVDEENSEKRSVRPSMITVLMHELKGSALKLFSNVDEADAETQERLSEFIAREYPPSNWDRFLGEFRQVCDHAMVIFREANQNRYSGLQKGAVVAYLEHHFQDPNLSLTAVATEFSVNDKYLSRFFKEQMGVNYHSYLESLRLEHARSLLEDSTLSLRRIAESSGYATQATFTRAFRKKFGLNPSILRQKQ